MDAEGEWRSYQRRRNLSCRFELEKETNVQPNTRSTFPHGFYSRYLIFPLAEVTFVHLDKKQLWCSKEME